MKHEISKSSAPEPSETLRAHPTLLRTFERGYLSLAECERRARGAERLKAAFSSIPWHAQAAQKDPDYWAKFYDSGVNW